MSRLESLGYEKADSTSVDVIHTDVIEIST